MKAANDSHKWVQKIEDLRRDKEVVILAHYYQEDAIQDIADFVGDSLDLSMRARAAEAPLIAFSGVHFMAETAKILNPGKKVVLPDKDAGCSLAESCPPDAFRCFVDQHPGAQVVSYINCSAEIKAMSDVICTSSNACQIIDSLRTDRPILFAPDKHLGNYLIQKTGRDMILWDGVCMVHDIFDLQRILDLNRKYPDALFVAHPECPDHILKVATFVGSTSALLRHVKQSDASTFIVGTEHGILHRMREENPDKILIPAPSTQDNSCACSECPYMKLNTLEKLYRALDLEYPEITLDESVRARAEIPLLRMFEMTHAEV